MTEKERKQSGLGLVTIGSGMLGYKVCLIAHNIPFNIFTWVTLIIGFAVLIGGVNQLTEINSNQDENKND